MTIDESLDSVARALTSDDASSRMLALEVIVGFSEDRAAGLLAAAVSDPDLGVRRAAIAAAARMGAKRVVSSLILALDDPDNGVRSEACRAIQTITGKAVEPAEGDRAEERRAAITELQAWWKRERYEQLAAQFGVNPNQT
jgi:HEAT repeat protein